MSFDLHSATSRRDAIKIGGLTVSLGALIAACGTDRDGDDAPGRVGNAPVATDLPDYPVDDAVLLRTASSLEYTAIAVYEAALQIDGAIPSDLVPVVERLIDDHQTVADQMVELTESAGGTGWTCAAAGQTVTCEHAAPLAGEASSAIEVITRITASGGALITNTASVSAGGGEITIANNSASANFAVVAEPPPTTPPPLTPPT